MALPPLVLLHGLGTGPRGWDPQVEAFGAERRVLAPPLRVDTGFTVQGLTNRLWEAIESDSVDVCGLSLGALVALRMALDRPERVRRLALCAAFASLPRRYRVFQAALAAVAALVPERILRGQLVAAVPEKARATARTETAGLVRGAIRAAFREGARFDVSSELDRLTMPVLVLVGERDRVNKRLSRALAEGLPSAELRVIPGAGHVANLEAPEAFTEALRSFLD